jgi:peptidoglycan/LPS O-acetylase OafA/YrhL
LIAVKRIPSLDGLRGIAAVMVMLYHFNIFFLPQARLGSLVPGLDRAYLAVDLFFLLSGLVMAHVYGAGLSADWSANWRLFARARFARIYPLFALTLAATVAVAVLFRGVVGTSRLSLMLQPFLLQEWIYGKEWNYPTWSISTEMEAYVVFAFTAQLLLAGRHPRIIAAGCGAIIVALSIVGDGHITQFSGFAALLRTVAGFCLGVLLYRAHKRDMPFLRKWAGVVAIAFFGAGFLTHQDFLIVGGFVGLTYYGIYATDSLGRLLNSRPALSLGNWSYSIYLWHAPVHMAVTGLFAASRHPVGNFDMLEARLVLIVTALFVVAVSAMTYQRFEKPMRRWIMTFWTRHHARIDPIA